MIPYDFHRTCTDFLTDASNCGGCGDFCPATCAMGQCQGGTMTCNSPTPDLCVCSAGSQCTNLQTDSSDCGTCGNVCPIGETCQRGVCTGCTSPNAPDQCSGSCTNFQSDPFNCGGCGNFCASGLCSRGQCLACTGSAPNSCGGQCTNLLSDPNYCGGCGDSCPAGQSCQQGRCAGISCAGDTPDTCGGNQCTNLKADSQNCGACGNVCVGGTCRNYNVVEWFGTVEETGTSPSGGTATLSLNTAITSTFHLTPSSTVPGGCDLASAANLNLIQSGGPIFGVWGGPWNCGGTVDASG